MPTSLTLQDSNGLFWLLTVDDSGLLHSASGASGPADNVTLNDSTNSASWSIAFLDAQERATATPATFNATNPKKIVLVSSPGNINWPLGVTLDGLLQTFGATVRNVRLQYRTNRWKGFRKHR